MTAVNSTELERSNVNSVRVVLIKNARNVRMEWKKESKKRQASEKDGLVWSTSDEEGGDATMGLKISSDDRFAVCFDNSGNMAINGAYSSAVEAKLLDAVNFVSEKAKTPFKGYKKKRFKVTVPKREVFFSADSVPVTIYINGSGDVNWKDVTSYTPASPCSKISVVVFGEN
jgi:hypothetical protein